MSEKIKMETYYLSHHGTKGMRWGVRRYQNSDGSLTPAGKNRYARELEKVKKAEKVLKNKQKTQAKFDDLERRKKAVKEQEKSLKEKPKKEKVKKEKPVSKKSVAEMSDDELRQVVTRLRLEQDYRNLTPKNVSAGKRFVNKAFNDVAKPMLVNSLRDTGTELAKKKLKKAMGLDDVNEDDRLQKEAKRLQNKFTIKTMKEKLNIDD